MQPLFLQNSSLALHLSIQHILKCLPVVWKDSHQFSEHEYFKADRKIVSQLMQSFQPAVIEFCPSMIQQLWDEWNNFRFQAGLWMEKHTCSHTPTLVNKSYYNAQKKERPKGNKGPLLFFLFSHSCQAVALIQRAVWHMWLSFWLFFVQRTTLNRQRSWGAGQLTIQMSLIDEETDHVWLVHGQMVIKHPV